MLNFALLRLQEALKTQLQKDSSLDFMSTLLTQLRKDFENMCVESVANSVMKFYLFVYPLCQIQYTNTYISQYKIIRIIYIIQYLKNLLIRFYRAKCFAGSIGRDTFSQWFRPGSQISCYSPGSCRLSMTTVFRD